MEILFGGTDNNNNSLNSDDILSGLGVQGSKSTTTLSELIDKYKAANTDIADNLTLDKSL